MEHRDLLIKWSTKAKRFRDAHYAESARLRRMHYILGIPSILVSASISTAVFATLEKTAVLEVRLAVASLSIVAAALSALHTFLRYSERAEAHRQAYMGYDSVSRHVDQVLCDRDISKSDLRADVDRIRNRLDELAQAPEISLISRKNAARVIDVAAAEQLPSSGENSDQTMRDSELLLVFNEEPTKVVPHSSRPPPFA